MDLVDANWCHRTTCRTRCRRREPFADTNTGLGHECASVLNTWTLDKVAFVKGDKKKQSLYFPTDMLDEMQREAERQERPLSWIMQQAWKLSRDKIMTYPGVEEL